MVSFVHSCTELHLGNLEIHRLLALCVYLGQANKLEIEATRYDPHLAGTIVAFFHQNSIQYVMTALEGRTYLRNWLTMHELSAALMVGCGTLLIVGFGGTLGQSTLLNRPGDHR